MGKAPEGQGDVGDNIYNGIDGDGSKLTTHVPLSDRQGEREFNSFIE